MRKPLYLSFILANSTYAFQGFYVGIGGGIANINSVPQGNTIIATGNSNAVLSDTPTTSVYWGYQYNKFLSLQLEYNYAYGVTIANTYQMNQTLLGMSFIGSLPLNLIKPLTNVSLFAKIGMDYNVINYYSVNSSCANCSAFPDSSFTYLPIYGIGINYDIKDYGIRMEVDQTTNNTASNNNISLVSSSMTYYLASFYYKF